MPYCFPDMGVITRMKSVSWVESERLRSRTLTRFFLSGSLISVTMPMVMPQNACSWGCCASISNMLMEPTPPYILFPAKSMVV